MRMRACKLLIKQLFSLLPADVRISSAAVTKEKHVITVSVALKLLKKAEIKNPAFLLHLHVTQQWPLVRR